VVERRAVVQQGVVVYELQIAALERHGQMKRRIVGKSVEQIECADIRWREARRIGETLRRIDVLALVDGRERIRVPVENRDREVRFLTGRYFTTPIGREWREQPHAGVGAERATLGG